MCKNPMTALSHSNRNFPLRGRLAVFSIDRPVIAAVLENIRRAHIDHGFDGEYHARNQQQTAIRASGKPHPWIFVKIQTDAMPADVLDAVNLRAALEQTPRRNSATLSGIVRRSFVNAFMAFFVLFPTAAPAGIVSIDCIQSPCHPAISRAQVRTCR